MALLFENVGASELSFEFLQVVVAIVAHLISDTDDHQLELVDLRDRLWGSGLLWCCLLCVKASRLGVRGFLFGELAWLLHRSFDHRESVFALEFNLSNTT